MWVKKRDWEEVIQRLSALEAMFAKTERLVENFELDYHNLYEKVRSNLAKLSKRASDGESPPQEPNTIDHYRGMLLERKLGRKRDAV